MRSVPAVGFEPARVQVRGLAHRKSLQVADLAADVAGHGDRECPDGVELVHAHQHGAMGLQAGEDLQQVGFVLGQGFVVEDLASHGQCAGVVVGFSDVESDDHVDGAGGHGRPPRVSKQQ